MSSASCNRRIKLARVSGGLDVIGRRWGQEILVLQCTYTRKSQQPGLSFTSIERFPRIVLFQFHWYPPCMQDNLLQETSEDTSTEEWCRVAFSFPSVTLDRCTVATQANAPRPLFIPVPFLFRPLFIPSPFYSPICVHPWFL